MKTTTIKKILLWQWIVKSKFASPKRLYLLAKIDDFGLKSGMLEENAKNSISACYILAVD
jgi:hypothetical protein